MHRIALPPAMILLFIGMVSSQPEKQWRADFDGVGITQDEIHASVIDHQGNIIVTGISKSPRYNIITVKYDSLGTVLWSAIYDSPEHWDESVDRIAADDSGNVYILGYSTGPGYQLGIVVLKYSPGGTLLWSSLAPNESSGLIGGRGIAPTSDGNVYVCGLAHPGPGPDKLFVRRFDDSGHVAWTAFYPDSGSHASEGLGIVVGADDAVYVAGDEESSNPESYHDGIVLKYSADGTRRWAGKESADSTLIEFFEIRPLPDGDLMVGGHRARDGGVNLVCSRWDTGGTRLWTATIDTPSVDGDYVTFTTDDLGNAFIVGDYYPDGDVNIEEVVVVSFDADGARRWRRRFNATIDGNEFGTSIAADAQGNAVLTGTVSTDSSYNQNIFTVKYDALGGELWRVFLDDSSGGADGGQSVAVLPSGKIVVSGWIDNGSAGYDGIAVGLDAGGSELWRNTIGGTTSSGDEYRAMTVDGEGNIVMTGATDPSNIGSGINVSTVKYAPDGSFLWSAVYDNGPGIQSFDRGRAVACDTAGNIFVTGVAYDSSAAILTIKYTPDGDEAWARKFPSIGYDNAGEYVAVDDSGNVVVAGNAVWTGVDAGNTDYTVIKYDGQGQQLWANHYAGPLGQDGVRSLALDDSGNAYVTGFSVGPGGQYDITTVRFSSDSGGIDWTTTFDRGGEDFPYAMARGQDGSLYVAGFSHNDSGRPAVVIRYDALGQEVWNDIHYVAGTDQSQAYDVAVDGNGYPVVVMVDALSRQERLVRYNASGSKTWLSDPTNLSIESVAIGGDGAVYTIGYQDYVTRHSVAVSKYGIGTAAAWTYADSGYWSDDDDRLTLAAPGAGTVFIAGSIFDPLTSYDFHLVKIADAVTGIDDDPAGVPVGWMLSDPFPNPFNPETRIDYTVRRNGFVSIRIYDILGREAAVLVDGVKEAGYHSVRFDGTGHPSGVYFCRMTGDGFTRTKKLILGK